MLCQDNGRPNFSCWNEQSSSCIQRFDKTIGNVRTSHIPPESSAIIVHKGTVCAVHGLFWGCKRGQL